MMDMGLAIGLIAAALVVGGALGFLIRRILAEKKIGSAEQEAKRILADCEKKAEAISKKRIDYGTDER